MRTLGGPTAQIREVRHSRLRSRLADLHGRIIRRRPFIANTIFKIMNRRGAYSTARHSERQLAYLIVHQMNVVAGVGDGRCGRHVAPSGCQHAPTEPANAVVKELHGAARRWMARGGPLCAAKCRNGRQSEPGGGLRKVSHRSFASCLWIKHKIYRKAGVYVDLARESGAQTGATSSDFPRVRRCFCRA